MKETRQAARRRGRRRTLWALTPVALVAGGALVRPAVAFRPGHRAETTPGGLDRRRFPGDRGSRPGVPGRIDVPHGDPVARLGRLPDRDGPPLHGVCAAVDPGRLPDHGDDGRAGGTDPPGGRLPGSGDHVRRRNRRRRLLLRSERRSHDGGDEPHGLRDVQGVRGLRTGARGRRRDRHGPDHQRMPDGLRPRAARPQRTGVRPARRTRWPAGSRSRGSC